MKALLFNCVVPQQLQTLH